ncbi:MAG: hypothetical protein RIB78_00635 [Gammaproteobacteria bacterium]
MLKPVSLFFSLLVLSTHSLAIEPELQQQGMFYFNVSFDAGTNTKTKHHFGFRIDQGMVKPGESMMLSALVKRPAALDIQYTRQGIQAFNVHGINYLDEVLVARGAEAGSEDTSTVAKETEVTPAEETVEAEPVEETVTTEATPRRELNIPFGVVLGLGIGLIAIAGSGN